MSDLSGFRAIPLRLNHDCKACRQEISVVMSVARASFSKIESSHVCGQPVAPLALHLTTSELWFGQEQEGILS